MHTGQGIEDEDNEKPEDDQEPHTQNDLGEHDYLVGDTSNSPMSTGSRKRGSSTIDIATSPHKKNKSPIISVFKGLIHTLQAGSKEEAKTLGEIYKKRMEHKRKEQEQEAQEIDFCMRLAVECGASECSNEYFMTNKLFHDKYNRQIFKKFRTNEGKLA
jgi:hypothetical protein